MISVRPAGRPANIYMRQNLQLCDFHGQYNYDKYQTLHDGTIHSTLPIHTIFSYLDCVLGSQQFRTFLTEYFVFLSD